jgi:hypothetical protein
MDVTQSQISVDVGSGNTSSLAEVARVPYLSPRTNPLKPPPMNPFNAGSLTHLSSVCCFCWRAQSLNFLEAPPRS